jgi:hypothetical protein
MGQDVIFFEETKINYDVRSPANNSVAHKKNVCHDGVRLVDFCPQDPFANKCVHGDVAESASS